MWYMWDNVTCCSTEKVAKWKKESTRQSNCTIYRPCTRSPRWRWRLREPCCQADMVCTSRTKKHPKKSRGRTSYTGRRSRSLAFHVATKSDRVPTGYLQLLATCNSVHQPFPKSESSLESNQESRHTTSPVRTSPARSEPKCWRGQNLASPRARTQIVRDEWNALFSWLGGALNAFCTDASILRFPRRHNTSRALDGILLRSRMDP